MNDLGPVPAGNATEWSVTDLAAALKRTLEDAFGFVRLRGEISGFRGPHSSGHCYFCLKDAGARIDAVIWKGTYARLRTKPQEGLEVIAVGRITTFPGKSTYQIVVESIEPAGIGALMALLDQRRKKLTAEGLFDEARKRPLPYLPRVIGVVTSPTGAVIRDILHRLEDRFPRRVLVWPVRVQGETSAAEVAAAIRGFNALATEGPIPRPDVLIVARGGGSIEDLWGFNEEEVVRAAAESEIPLVAAVGHETDWTLIDFAADLRAPTPTGAAEMVVPVRGELLALVHDLGRRHEEAALRMLERRRTDLRSAARALPWPDAFLAQKRQRLDLAAARLGPALARRAREVEQRLARTAQALARRSPAARIAEARGQLKFADHQPLHLIRRLVSDNERRTRETGERLAPGLAAQIARRRAHFDAVAGLFGCLNHNAVLKRGYALVRGEDGRTVREAAAVDPGRLLQLEFADGKVRVVAEGEAPPGGEPPDPSGARAPAPRPARRKPATTVQGSLFD